MTSPPSPCQALLGAVRARESETNHPTPVLLPPETGVRRSVSLVRRSLVRRGSGDLSRFRVTRLTGSRLILVRQ